MVGCFGLVFFGVLLGDFLVTFVGSGSGSWYCGFLLVTTQDDVPIGEPCMFHRLPLTAGGRGNCSGLSISHSLAALTASIVFFLLSLSAIYSYFFEMFFGQACVLQ